ncbi:hypothetical protein BU25DRAFT_434854 [Macroventuria anomochaeta]|uniref:Uncharacterized protein n=1 Tax=Macroventuria anomochaeta TaxID=301207 RepID=A0ACB6RKT7_9PLEO|nr:uncharacterized protein BU25DRAFT_434854 [Macroventuria anomochaeta]KAF2622545.1 hypothetical protein BU25DRAFT_434854 [Macroventuria anomochaeta]
MHFSASAFVTLLTAALAVAAPTAEPNNKYTDKKISDCKKDLDNEWNQKDNEWKKNEKAFYFDAEYIVKATPDQVINTTQIPTPGEPGARGLFKYGINIADNTICYNITLSGVTGEYQSLALTSTHIHEAPKGRAGPPRIALPNPKGPDERRISTGCLTGPFKTGILANGVDTGDNFHVRQIVANPANFFTDTHTAKFVPGAVRSQLK